MQDSRLAADHASDGSGYHGSCLDTKRTDQMKITTTKNAMCCIALLVGAIFLGSALMSNNLARAVVGSCLLICGVSILLAGRRPSPR